jgi:phosphatidate phosphatase APP1
VRRRAAILAPVVRLLHAVEQRIDAWRRRRISRGELDLVVYAGYGTATMSLVRGRVLRHRPVLPMRRTDSWLRRGLATWRRFTTDEVPGIDVTIHDGAAQVTVTTDEEGYFVARLAGAVGQPCAGWREATCSLLAPGPDALVTSFAAVRVPAPSGVAIISDIDDTVLRTGTLHPLQLAYTWLLTNAFGRGAMPGVPALYAALRRGAAGIDDRAFFYVSSSPWNMVDVLTQAFALLGIPRGPLVLRDWGLSANALLPTDHHEHKHTAIAGIMECYPQHAIVLLGDDAQHDPEIYAGIVAAYPQRVAFVGIRQVSRRAARAASVAAVLAQIRATGTAVAYGGADALTHGLRTAGLIATSPPPAA